MMEVVLSTGAIRCAKLQSNYYTNVFVEKKHHYRNTDKEKKQ